MAVERTKVIDETYQSDRYLYPNGIIKNPDLRAWGVEGPDQTSLTPEQLEYYDTNGFVLITGVLDDAQLSAMRVAADDLLEYTRPHVEGKPRLDIEGSIDGAPVVRKIQPVCDCVPALDALAKDPHVVGRAASILGPNPLLFEDKLNYKPPKLGSEFPLHHDWGYWKYHHPELTTLISMMIFFDSATLENGCMRIFPGSHKVDIPCGKDVGAGSPTLAPGWLDREACPYLPAPAGSLLIFSCHTVHCSDPNESDQGRQALILSYHHAALGDLYHVRNGVTRQRADETDQTAWWNEGLERGVEWARHGA